MELAKITETHNPYLLALQSQRVTALKKQEAVSEYIDMLTKVYFEAGHAMPGKTKEEQVKQLQILSIAFHEEVQTYFKFMRVEEIRQALKNGVRKQYGDFHGINIATLHNWLKSYVADEKRVLAILKLKQQNEKEPEPLVTPEQAEQDWREAILRQFRQFKETGYFVCELPTFQYQQFEKRGMIRLTEERKKEIYEQAKIKIQEAYRIKRLNPKDKNELNRLSDAIKRMDEGKPSDTDKKFIQNEARRMAIKEYYESIETINF